MCDHAGFNSAGEPDLSIREPFWETYDGRHGRVVIGHTPRPAVERHQRIVLIDTGAVYGGLLSAYCPETDAVVQVQGQRSQEPFPRSADLDRVPALLSGDEILADALPQQPGRIPGHLAGPSVAGGETGPFETVEVGTPGPQSLAW